MLLGLSSLCPQDALADAAVRLTVDRAKGALSCPDQEALAAEVSALAPRLKFSSSGAVVVDVVIRPSGPGFIATIQLSGARSGQRLFEDKGPGCAVLARALVLAIAILLDTDAEPAAEEFYLWPAVPTPEPVRTSTTPLPYLSGSIAPVFDAGTLHDVAAGVALTADLSLKFATFGAGVVWLPADRFDLGTRAVDYSFIAGRLRVCSNSPFPEFGVHVCSGVLIGQRSGAVSAPTAQASRGSKGAFGTFESQIELSRRILGPGGIFASLGVGAPLVEEPIELSLAGGAKASLKPTSLTLQTTIGLRFWLDL